MSESSLRALEAAFVPAATPPKITSRINEILPLCLPPQSTAFAPTAKESLLLCPDPQPGARRSPRECTPGDFHSHVRTIGILGLGVPCGLVAPFGLVPVHDVPPGIYVLGTAVLVFQVVGMLPHV